MCGYAFPSSCSNVADGVLGPAMQLFQTGKILLSKEVFCRLIHDISFINVYDPREREIPNVGFVRVRDAESGRESWVDTASVYVRNYYTQWGQEVLKQAQQLFNKYRVDSVSICTNEDYVKSLIKFFKQR